MTEKDECRRLIIVILEHGKDPGLEYEGGELAPWEVVAALNEAAWLVGQEEEEDAQKEE